MDQETAEKILKELQVLNEQIKQLIEINEEIEDNTHQIYKNSMCSRTTISI